MKFISRIKSTIKKVTKRIHRKSFSLFRNKPSGAATSPPPPDTTEHRYSTPFHNSGPSPLPATTIAASPNISPSPCLRPDCTTLTPLPAQADQPAEQPEDYNPTTTPTTPQLRTAIPAAPLQLPLELTPIKRAGGLIFLRNSDPETRTRYATISEGREANGYRNYNPKAHIYGFLRKLNTRAKVRNVERMVFDYVIYQLALVITMLMVD